MPSNVSTFDILMSSDCLREDIEDLWRLFKFVSAMEVRFIRLMYLVYIALTPDIKDQLLLKILY